MIYYGDALELISDLNGLSLDLVVTDPPYAFGGNGDEHEISATVAVVLREAAVRLKKGRWMLVFCASSWRSQAYMVEAVRGVLTPTRVATWCKPLARTKTRTTGWAWASVKVIAFRKGKSETYPDFDILDHIEMAPVTKGLRAELPTEVARWAVSPFAVSGGVMLDPFAGSGALCKAAEHAGMKAIGFEKARP